jgi:tetratricopeptide (TPR) repeat protein
VVTTYYSGRVEVERALSALPPTTDPSFLQEIRRVIDRTRNPESTFRQVCGDMAKPASMRFCALYAVLLRLRREERLSEYAELVNRNEQEFGGEPYFHTFRAVILRLEGELASLLQAIEHSREAARLLRDVPGVQHQVAEFMAEYLERRDSPPQSRELDEAENSVDRAITLSYGRVAHYFETKARILCLKNDFDTARSLVRRAIELEPREGLDYLRRISQYQTTRVKIDVFSQRADWVKSRDSFRREMSQFRTQQLELLGLLAGVVAFVASTANIASQATGSVAVRLVTAMAGALTIVFSSFFLLVNNDVWRRVALPLAIGFLLLIAGLLAPSWLVHT